MLDESARTSLRSALAELRRAVGAELIGSDRDTVGLAEGVWVDLHEFDELARAGDADRAFELVRGELMAGLSEEGVYDARERQRERERELLARSAERPAISGQRSPTPGGGSSAIRSPRRQAAS